VTDEPQSQSSPGGEPVTEVRAAIGGEQPTAQHRATPSEPVTLPTQVSAPVTASPAATRPPIPPPVPPAVETGPRPGPSPIDKVTALVAERPEVGVGGAFAGGIVFALILKRLGR
jgi:hypothetical protein